MQIKFIPSVLKFREFLFILIFVYSLDLKGQGLPPLPTSLDSKPITITPPAPTTCQLAKFVDIPVNLYTGIPEINIPIYTINESNIGLPISLSYHAGGFKVDEEASWVGLGWSLNAGGVITRSVIGLPDEYINGPYKGFNGVASNLNFSSYNGENSTFLYNLNNCTNDKLARGEWDLSPDIYYLNFNGNTAKMFFDKDGVAHFTPYKCWKLSGNVTTGFIIITEDGTKYIFTASETAHSVSESYHTFMGNPSLPSTNLGPHYKSAWYLTRIENPNNTNSITLDYIADGYTHTSTSESKVLSNPGNQVANPSPVPLNPPQNGTPHFAFERDLDMTSTSTTTIYGTKKLNAINSNFITVEFNSSTRLDNGENKLDEIIITNKQTNAIIKSYKLSYDYFKQPLALHIPGEEQMEYRLKLTQIKEIGENQDLTTPPFAFTYYEGSIFTDLPRKDSKGQDYWGFPNGKETNTTLIPELHRNLGYETAGGATISTVVAGADREPDSKYCAAGLLKELRFPTGGKNQYFYEGNIFRYVGDKICNTMAQNNKTVNAVTDGIHHENRDLFTIPFTQSIELTYHLSGVYSPDPPQSYVRLINAATNIDEYYMQCPSGIGPFSATITINNLAPGTYIVAAGAMFLQTDNASITVNYFDPPTITYYDIPTGGARISKIIENPVLASNPSIETRYDYTLDNGGSSGVLVNYPKYVDNIYMPYTYAIPLMIGMPPTNVVTGHFKYILRHSNSFIEIGRTQGSHIGYSKVTKFIGSSPAEVGSEENYFTSARDFPDIGGLGTPFAPAASFDELRGLLLKQVIKNSSGVKRLERLNSYNYNNHIGDPNFGWQYGFKNSVFKGGTAAYGADGCLTSCFGLDWSYNWDLYKIYSFWPTLSHSELSSFDVNGNLAITTRSDFEYSNPLHAQITKISEVNSDGKTHIKMLKYPSDYLNSITGNTFNIAVNLMASSLNMQNVPIEKYDLTFNPSSGLFHVISGEIDVYSSNICSGKILPEKILKVQTSSPILKGSFTFLDIAANTYDSRFKVSREYLDFDCAHANIIKYKENASGIEKSFEWDKFGKNLIASFENASLSIGNSIGDECSFIGFENPTLLDDRWGNDPASEAVQIVYGQNIDTHTGNGYGILPFSLVSGTANIGPVKRFKPSNPEQSFIFSAWVKTPESATGNVGSIVIEIDNKSELINPNNPLAFVEKKFSYKNDWQFLEVSINLEDLNKMRISHTNVDHPDPFYLPLIINCHLRNYTNSLNINIDDIRFSPALSLVQSYTYDFLFDKLSSKSDQNSLPSYFDYDSYARLIFTKDMNKKVITANNYHYRDLTITGDMNFTKNTSLKDAFSVTDILSGINSDKFLTSINYADGLGRPIQTVVQNGTDDWSNIDIIQPIEYDAYGRISKNYLPYSMLNNYGAYRPNYASEQSNWYLNQINGVKGLPNSQYPFSETLFDNSPLNQVLEQGFPGDTWQLGNGHSISTNYSSNGVDEVLNWDVAFSSLCSASAPNKYYNPNELNKKTVINENGVITNEFTDKKGKLIMQQKTVSSSINADNGLPSTFDFPSSTAKSNVWYSTYYCYNDLGNLAYIIPPQAIELMGNTTTFNSLSPIFNDLIYAYHYDERGRVIEIKIPGENGWHWKVYNKLDQLVMTSTPEQHSIISNIKWIVNKYDALGRIVFTGLTSGSDRTTMQANVNNQTNHLWEKRTIETGNIFNYTNITYPVLSAISKILTVNYFDDYEWNTSGRTFIPSTNYSETSYFLKGLLTGTLVNILGTNINLTNLNFYNDKAQIIQQQNQNQLNGWDVIDNVYNFTGQTKSTIRKHVTPNKSIIVKTNNTYNHLGQLTDIWKNIDGGMDIHMVNMEYNQLGQLIRKKLHYDWRFNSEWMQSIDYRYNIRGWLTSINNASLLPDPAINPDDNDIFGEELYYDNASTKINITGSVKPAIDQFSGNISATIWKTQNPNATSLTKPKNLYTFRYDNLNRLTAGYYGAENPLTPNLFNLSAGAYDEKQSYDMMGNIIDLKRYSKNVGLIDDLTYSYINNGNHLISISDAATTQKLYDYHDNNFSTDYSYNSNGSQIIDNNKHLTTTYNHLDLPNSVTNQSGQVMNITYDANGRKLSCTEENGTRYYIDGIEYSDTQLDLIETEEGRVHPKGTNCDWPDSYVYDYTLKDHLGNVRALITTETCESKYLASMEVDRGPVEEDLFDFVPETRSSKPVAEPSDVLTEAPVDDMVSELDGTTGNTIGHSKTLEMMEGDKVNIDVKYFFQNNQVSQNLNSVLGDLLNQLASSMFAQNGGTATASIENQQAQYNSLIQNTELNSFLTGTFGSLDQQNMGKPKAYLVHLFFNKDFIFIPSASGIYQTNTPNQLGDISVINLNAPDNGYMYIYVSNNSPLSVSFNNLQISHFNGLLLEENHYYPYGLLIEDLSRRSNFGIDNKKKFNNKELISFMGINEEDFGARYYDASVCRWNVVDPLASLAPCWSPYRAFFCNPIKFVDPTGMFESTHTDENGNVLEVKNDGDNEVYKHTGSGDAAKKDFEKNYSESNTSAGGTKMGKTAYWDEFVSPESGKVLTETKIQFGKSFDPIIKTMNDKAKDMDLREIAANSAGGGLFDIKKDYKNVGALLNGKYATSRSAGNFLAGYNAEGGTYFGLGISFETFQKLAGALHVMESQEKKLTDSQKKGIVIFGNSYGPAPAYGEIMYQYRMSKAGWNKAKLNNK